MTDSQFKLSEKAVNILENLALCIAERKNGKITANDLIPYLPVSLDIIKEVLDNLVDNNAVFKEKSEESEIPVYFFTAHQDAPFKKGNIVCDCCIGCSNEKIEKPQNILCARCIDILLKELNRLAEKTAWPAQAVYEHEILYLASKYSPPHYGEKLAGHSSFTVRNMQKKLQKLYLEGSITQVLDEEKGLIEYRFPEIDYPKEFYKKNISVIRNYPASFMEEIEVKLVRILFSIAGLGIFLFLAAFLLKMPFIIMIFLMFILSPLTAMIIWKHKKKVIIE